MSGLPNVGEARFHLDTRDKMEIGMCRNGGGERAASAEHLQCAPRRTAVTLSPNGECPHRRCDINHP